MAGKFRWCFPRFVVYRPATNIRPPRIALNRYPGAIIGAEIGLLGRRWGVVWKRG